MSGTRARQIRLDIAGVLEGLTLDRRAGTSDSFKFMDVPRRPDSAGERTFRVIIAAQPTKGRHNTCDDYENEFTIERYYSLAPGVEDRISDDTERMYGSGKLNSLHVVNGSIMISDCAAQGVEETQSNYVARDSVICTYRLDSTLL